MRQFYMNTKNKWNHLHVQSEQQFSVQDKPLLLRIPQIFPDQINSNMSYDLKLSLWLEILVDVNFYFW